MTTTIDKLRRTMAALRDAVHGCPWDRKQNHRSLLSYLLEETYEVVDAIEQGDDTALCEELGDLLFQIVFHARIAEEQARFDFDDVARRIDEKLIRRHPHVFADTTITSDAELDVAWERAKAEEKPRSNDRSRLDGIATALPALMQAQKLQRRAARAGFDWPNHKGPLEKIHEETGEIEAELDASERRPEALEAEIGDLLFSVVNLARHLDIDAEQALRRANEKFRRRFRKIEQSASESGVEIEKLDADALEKLWQHAKSAEGPGE